MLSVNIYEGSNGNITLKCMQQLAQKTFSTLAVIETLQQHAAASNSMVKHTRCVIILYKISKHKTFHLKFPSIMLIEEAYVGK